MSASICIIRKEAKRWAAACVLLAAAMPVSASVITNGHNVPVIVVGELPDTPEAHVDPNVPQSAYSGVVSINIRYDGQSFICTGALVGRRQVVSAGHCVDTVGNGTVINLNAPGNDVRVVFNDGVANSVINASAVSLHPDYQGFGVCPPGVDTFCLNDDVSVITLGADAPATAKIYKVAVNPLQSGTHITMAGYGISGDGINGYTIPPDFRIKRIGENYVDLFDADDELGFTGPSEVWYADFDGGGQDVFCEFFEACSPRLPNDREATIAGGDSGGPSFINLYGELVIAATNTFSGRFQGQPEGTFGTYMGGNVLAGYADFLLEATGGHITLVPEPAGVALFGLALLAALTGRRRLGAWRRRC